MASNWDVYITECDGEPCVVALDLDARPDGRGYDTDLCEITTLLQAPDEYGFPTRAESENVIYPIEDLLTDLVPAELGGRYVGRYIRAGVVVYLCYFASGVEIKERIGRALNEFSEFEFGIETRPDPEWSAYFETLYPSEEEFQIIMNSRVLRKLREGGDRLTTPREVDFWIYFRTDTDRTQYREFVVQKGFEIREESRSDDFGEYRYKLQIYREMPVDAQSVDEICLRLLSLAQDYDAKFDGWETTIVKDG